MSDKDLLIEPPRRRRKEDLDPPLMSNTTLNWIAKIGVPSAIALYLVYMITAGISAEIRDIKDEFLKHSNQAVDLVRQYEQMRIQSDRQTYILQRICINSAKTDQQKEECIAR